MTPSAIPGEADPHDVDGRPLPWGGLGTQQVKGNRNPRPEDLARHEHGAVQEVEDELREEAREMLRRAVAKGIPASNAKVAIVVGAVVELKAIQSRLARAQYETRVAAQEASA